MNIPGSVVIACPFRDLELAHRVKSLWEMAGAPNHLIFVDDDLCRARSRIVRKFLNETDGDHVLMIDHDVPSTPDVVHEMLAERVDCIGTTYPKKRLGPNGKVAGYAYDTKGVNAKHDGRKAQVAAVGFGCMLLSRKLLSRMWEAYEEELSDWGELDDKGQPQRTVMLFKQEWGTMGSGLRTLLPEDYSFCERVRTICPVHMLVTRVLPHVGSYVYTAPPPVPPSLDPPEVDPKTGVDPADPNTPSRMGEPGYIRAAE